MLVERLSDRTARRQKPYLITDRESGLQAMVLHANFAALCGNIVASALDNAKPLPTIILDGPAVSFANQMVALEGNNCSGSILVEVILHQLSDEIVAVEIE